MLTTASSVRFSPKSELTNERRNTVMVSGWSFSNFRRTGRQLTAHRIRVHTAVSRL